MDAERWRSAAQAPTWKVQPHHHTTGVASTSDAHCHPGNCRGGAIDSTITGTVSTAAHSRRRRSAADAAAASPASIGASAAGAAP